MGHFVLHAGVGIADCELGGDEEFEEGGAIEIDIDVSGMGSFEFRHTFEEPKEELVGVIGWVDALVTQFGEVSPIPMVEPDRYESDVGQRTVLSVSVNMVHFVALGCRT